MRTILCFLGIAVVPGQDPELRSDLERELPGAEAACRQAPGDPERRRAYADLLFKLGNIREANDVVAPLATPNSGHAGDLRLAFRIALMVADYARAESLLERLAELGDPAEGLAMVYYQTNRYALARGLKEKDPLVTFMQRFEGDPYKIEWAAPEKTAHLPFLNDVTSPGALPHVRVEVNGAPLELVLDTGGDRLILDKSAAEKIGVREIATRSARYAYTKGETVEELLGAAETVRLGEVTLRNVPVIGAEWKSRGQSTDGALTTQILKQFLSTVDYDGRRITLRERGGDGRRDLRESFGPKTPIRVPFTFASTHLMFVKGSLDGRQGLNLLVDSGLAASMPLVILDETARDLGIERTPIPGTRYTRSPIRSHGIGPLVRGPAEALGNVLVEENSYRRLGFIFDALISHQYLRHLGSWTIDFDTMTYLFPSP